jgi:putative ABC transport system ATP-binding protein
VRPLEADGLHRFYRSGDVEVAALRDVSVHCDLGECVAVVGPSGSGKSTLLALLAGLDDPDGGVVRVSGQRLSHLPPRASARLRAREVGILTQGGGLLPHLSVLENVEFAATLRGGRPVGCSGPDPVALVDGLGLGAVRGARPQTLSGGETARAGLAVALAGSPSVLLADEPTAEVSAAEEEPLLDLLARWRPAEGALVLVTHSPAVARRADRVLRLVDGRLS